MTIQIDKTLLFPSIIRINGYGVKLGFIISGYKRPDLLVRLVGALEGRPCAIHIDAKSPIFDEIVEALKDVPDVSFLPRHNCHWGSFGHVDASLKGLRWLRTTDCDYAVLLTGQCYPLRTISSIEHSLATLNGRSIIDHQPFPHSRWENGGWPRVDRFYVQAFGRPRPVKVWRAQSSARRSSLRGHVLLVSFPGERGLYSRVHRCNIPISFVFFESVLIPDEIFFQTILANSPLRDALINDTVHYIEWTLNQPNPNVLASAEQAFASGKWFARKFEDVAVLDAIDKRRTENSLFACRFKRVGGSEGKLQ